MEDVAGQRGVLLDRADLQQAPAANPLVYAASAEQVVHQLHVTRTHRNGLAAAGRVNQFVLQVASRHLEPALWTRLCIDGDGRLRHPIGHVQHRLECLVAQH